MKAELGSEPLASLKQALSGAEPVRITTLRGHGYRLENSVS